MLKKLLEKIGLISAAKPGQSAVIYHPKENEIITHPHYTIKIGINGRGHAEVSIDGGPWRRCRHSEGFWWFDWANYPLGNHKITARLCDDKGTVICESKIIKCVFKT